MIKFKDENDSKTPISYLTLVSIFLRHYEDLSQLDSVFHWINPDCLLDIGDKCSDIIQKMLGYGISSTHELIEQRIYKFVEPEGRHGRIEVSFHNDMLVNSRLQLNFHGTGGTREALHFVDNDLRAVISGCLEEDNYQYDSSTHTYFNATALRNYRVAYQKEPNFHNVTTWITHISFYS